MMRFKYQLQDHWPALAWIARLIPGNHTIVVDHGPRVETRKEWFCEAVWAGDFNEGNFDRTDLFFGSGGRSREDGVTFVPSASTVDRLVWMQVNGDTILSNSLPCLVQNLGITINPTINYHHFFGSITRGLSRYAHELPTPQGSIVLQYFQNMKWNGLRLTEEEKPYTAGGFESFDAYRAFLEDAIKQIATNVSSAARQFPYSMLGTISSGYDAAAVATLTSKAGLREVISFTPAHDGKPDKGDAVATALGIKLTEIDRRCWRDDPTAPEHLFLAGDAKGQDIFFHSARDVLPGKAVLTGYFGDMCWDKNIGKELGAKTPDFVRGDRSGLSMTEYRLHAGFIHCPIPFLGARLLADIDAITQSPEMQPWDIGGNYTRPIPRRMLEEAGVPREAFGQRKIGLSVLFFDETAEHSQPALKDYRKWLRARSGQFWKRYKLPPHIFQRLLRPMQMVAKIGWPLNHRFKSLPRPLRALRAIPQKMGEFSYREFVADYMFAWALERSQASYVVVKINRCDALLSNQTTINKPDPSGSGYIRRRSHARMQLRS